MIVPVVNTAVNPGNQEYKKYYLEDQNIVTFDSLLGSYAFGYIREDKIETDMSVMPWKHHHY